ncbi:MAG: enoyl-CoA hydratase/isomerase family protein [Hyphomonadaceae bacterium]|nr:enoyl-CoA hydratase/isomerase family protein [Hyphomonadaceae bacterium]
MTSTHSESPPNAVLAVRKERGVAWVAINNPPINLIDMRLAMELDALSRTIEAAADIQVVVFESAVPDYFLSHADFGLLQQARNAGRYADTSQLSFYQRVLERFRTMPKISIGMIDGRARGGGAEFALALDMVFASPSARFSQLEILVGINPGGGGAQYLARKAGRSRALELCLGGADVGGDLAVSYGYANRLLPAAELRPFVERLARNIASFPPEALAANKANILAAEPHPEPGLIDAYGKFAGLVASPEFDRRVAAFMAAGGQTAAGEYKDPAMLSEQLA